MTTMTRQNALERLFRTCQKAVENRPGYPALWIVDTLGPAVQDVCDAGLPVEELTTARARREVTEAENTLNGIIRQRRELDETEARATEKLTAAQQLLRDAETLADVNAARGLAGADYRQHETKGDEC